MSQELESAKYFQHRSPEEIRADEKRAAGSSNWGFAAKSLSSLVVWAAVLGGGGFMVYNAVNSANRKHRWSGHGGHPALSFMSYCMGLVDFDWDNRVEQQIGSNPRPSTPRAPGTSSHLVKQLEFQELPNVPVPSGLSRD